MILVKPISGSHDFYTYNIASQQLTENSLALSHSFIGRGATSTTSNEGSDIIKV